MVIFGVFDDVYDVFLFFFRFNGDEMRVGIFFFIGCLGFELGIGCVMECVVWGGVNVYLGVGVGWMFWDVLSLYRKYIFFIIIIFIVLK